MRKLISLLIGTLIFCTSFSQTITYSGSASFCAGVGKLLTATPSATYRWEFSSTGSAPWTVLPNGPTYLAMQAGSYRIGDIPGTQYYNTISLSLDMAPVANFTFTPANVCGNIPVNFTNTSTGGNSYDWNFGDVNSGGANTSASPNPAHTFVGVPGNGSQNFNVRLITTNAAGCKDTITRVVTLKQLPDVTLGGTGSVTYNGIRYFTACGNGANATFTFVNQSTTGATNTDYTIFWGDASAPFTSPDFSAPVQHTYNTGTYNLLFIVTGQNGCKDTARIAVFVGGNPAVGFGNPGNTAICTGSTLTFPVSNTGSNSLGTIYTVTFNDGTPTLLFSHPAPADVSHTFNTFSCGTNSPGYPNSFSATIQASNPCASSSAIIVPIYVSQKSNPSFTIAPKDTVCVNSAVTLTNTTGSNSDIFNGTCRPGKSIWKITPTTGWALTSGTLGNDFGSTDPNLWIDGSPIIGLTFSLPGTYSIKLKTGNSTCGNDSIIKTICVNPIPTGSFTLSQNAGCAPLTVNTTSIANTPFCGTNTYSWIVGYTATAGCSPSTANYTYLGGTSNSSPQPVFQFNSPGIYSVGLWLIGPAASCSTLIASQQVTVKSKPLVTLGSLPANVCGNQAITPTAISTCYINSATTYAWSFPGGTPASSTLANPGTIIYNTPGTNILSLAVTNECGTTTVTQPVVVKPTPVATVPANDILCAGLSAGPYNFSTSLPGTSFTWTNNNTAIGLSASGSGAAIPIFNATNAGASPITATITVTATLNGCSSVASFTITVNPRPAAPLITTPVTYCQNTAAVALTATALPGHSLIWYTTATGGTGSTTAPVPVTTVPNTFTFYVSQQNNTTGCEGPRALITVVVNPGPVIGGAVAGNPASCATNNGSITLSGLTPFTSYVVHYTIGSTPMSINATSNSSGILAIANLGAGVYSNIYVVLNNCPSNSVGPFTLSDPNPPVTPVAAANNNILCSGQTLNLSASTTSTGTATYNWSGPNGFSMSGPNQVINNITVAGAGTYFVTVTIAGCTSASASLAVTVNPTPALPMPTSNQPVCSGQSLNLTASAAAGTVSYVWTGPNGFNSTDQNPVIDPATTAASGLYTLVITAATGNCPSMPGSTTIVVNQTPAISNASFTQPTSCGSTTGTITLTGLVPGVSYTVNYLRIGVPVSVPATANTAGEIVISGLTQGVYSNINVVRANCVSNVVGPFTLVDPTPPLAPGAAGNSPICSGGTLSLTAVNNSAGVATYTWSGPGGFTSSNQNPVISNISTAASGTYNVFVTISGCTSPVASVTIAVDSTPALPVVSANSPVCSGNSITLSASTASAGTMSYLWAGPAGFSSILQNPVIPNATVAQSGSYTVTATAAIGGCTSAIGNTSVIVHPTPVIIAATGANPANCNTPSGSITLSGLTSNTTYNIQYLQNGNPQTTVLVSDATGAVTIPSLIAGTYTNIGVILSNCNSNLMGPVVLSDPNPPAPPTATSGSPVCSGQSLTFSASTAQPGTATYAWTGPNGFISSISNPVILSASAASAGTYLVTVTINNCTSAATQVPVVINPLPIAPVAASPVSYCINTVALPLTATGAAGNPVFYYNTAVGGTGTLIPPVPSTSATGATNYYASQQNSFGCEGPRALIVVQINPDAIALFNPTETIKCPPFPINAATVGLQLFPANNSVYEWYANNIFIGSGTVFPGYTILAENDSVTIKLKAISTFGCKADSTERKFYTLKLPHPSFELTDTVGCGPLTVQVTNTTPDITLFNYFWDFGNGQTSTLVQPGTIVFQANPTFADTVYHVKLKIFSVCDTITVSRYVRVKSKPRALFSPSRTTGCSPMTVTFANTSAGNNNTYHWDFGDGTTTVTNTLSPISHTYNTGVVDTFYVKLVAINECGADSISYALFVSPNNINLNFSVNGPEHFGCAPHTVAFINNTSGASTFNWDFGDGNILSTTDGIDTVYHTYLIPGNFTVTLVAANSCTDTTITDFINVFVKPTAAFTADNYTACQGSIIHFANQSSGGTSYIWDFGDGITTANVNPSHSYAAPGTYTVSLTVFSSNAPGNVCSGIITQLVQVVAGLPGNFSMSATGGSCAPLTVTFINSNRPSATAAWNFGDGFTATGDSVVHTFITPGVFSVTLVATTPGGCTYTNSRAVTLAGPSGSIQYIGGVYCSPTVRFEATASNFNTINWNFGDGQTLSTTSLVVFHTYANPGAYLPSVTIQNNTGCNFPVQGQDTIKIDRIEAGFVYNLQQSCGSTRVNFTDTSHAFYGKALVKWNYGDAATGTGVNTSHVYNASGPYAIQMIVISNSGCSDTITKQINIHVNNVPVTSISGAAESCGNQTVLFTANTVSADAISITQWRLSNGVTSNNPSFSYFFTMPGNYTLRLITGTVNGCFDTAFHSILVKPVPVVNVTNSLTLCLGNSAQLNATGAANWQWTPTQGLSCTSCANPVATPTSTTAYVVTGTNPVGCPASDTVVITVIQPMNLVASPDAKICIGTSINLLVSGAATYAWTPAIGLSNTNTSNPTASPIVTTRYRVVGYDGFNCFTDTAFILVAVGKIPTVNLGPDLVLATGAQHPLVSTIINGPVAQWLWSPATDLSCNNCALPIANIKKDITYQVKITTEYGCTATDTINIKTFCLDTQVFIPNAFTPDGDGKNDVLMVRGSGIVTVKFFRIFNRWGELIFERNNFPPNVISYGWNGKVRGVVGPPDVFVYTAEVVCENGSSFIYKGNTSIIK